MGVQAERKLRVRDLVDNRTLGLKVVVEGNLNAEVLGAHTIEIDQPGSWLEPGWVMLTTGMRFVGVADSSAAQAELMAGLHRRGVPALLFGVGVHFDTVPHGLIKAAADFGVALISIDADVPFLAVERAVNHSVMSAEASQLKQNLQVQTDLITALADDQPIQSLVRRMGRLIKGTAILYEESGSVVASTGDGPAMLIWSSIKSTPSAQLRFTVGRWHVVARPTVLRGVGYWIALGSRREEVLDEIGEHVLDSTQRLLGAIRGVRTLSAAQSVAESAQILRSLRSSITPETADRTWDRMRSFRFQRGQEIRAFVTASISGVEPRALRGVDGDDITDRAVGLAHDIGLPLLLEVDEYGVSGIVGESEMLDQWCRLLAEQFHVGLSEPFVDLHASRSRRRDAVRAMRVAQRRVAYKVAGKSIQDRRGGSPGMIVKFEDADVINWLLSSRSVEAFNVKAEQQFGELLEKTELVETLVAYFGSGMDAKTTAATMFLHPNSVRYRLRRVEEIIEAPLSSPAVIANLYVVLHDQLSRNS